MAQALTSTQMSLEIVTTVVMKAVISLATRTLYNA